VAGALPPGIDEPVLHRVSPEIEPGPHLTIVCFNLLRGLRLTKVLGALRHHPLLAAANVVCLQEVDRGNGRTGGLDLAGLIARELALNLVYGIEFYELNKGRRSGGGDCGNAILTNLPFDRPRIIPLPDGFDWSKSRTQPRIGRRMAVAIDLAWGGAKVRIVNAHLENQCLARYRRHQLQSILDAEAGAGGPTILVGDMNTFLFREARHFSTLAARHGFADAMPLRPRGTWGRFFKLDWILVRGLRVSASGICRDVTGSDHKPLWAKVERDRGGEERAGG
jgi:endonuclease/exonuclease/phosphatase family metal-dependent hydrolase